MFANLNFLYFSLFFTSFIEKCNDSEIEFAERDYFFKVDTRNGCLSSKMSFYS